MKAASVDFNQLVESIYNLPLECKEELKNMLEHNIAEDRRNEIGKHFKDARKEEKAGKLKFGASVRVLIKML